MSSARHTNRHGARRSHRNLASRTGVIWVRGFFLLAAVLALSSMHAHADDDTDTFTVSADVLATCDVTANDLDFGDYDPIAAVNLDAQTSISVTCTNGTAYDVGMSLGSGAGASVATRYMAYNGNLLAYTLYQNSQRTTLWSAPGGANLLSGTGDGTPDAIDVFGRVPMQQSVPAGNYSDSITVTVSW